MKIKKPNETSTKKIEKKFNNSFFSKFVKIVSLYVYVNNGL